jgi:uncharacterized protein (TIGR02145 family)
MADFATEINDTKIRTNVTSWNVLNIPKFEDPLETFWNNVYGLGGCAESRSGVVLKNKNAKSKNADVYYMCNVSRSSTYPYDYKGHWVNATTYQKDTYQWTAGKEDELKKGNVTDTVYVYNGTQWVVSERETSIGLCMSSKENVVSKYEGGYYACHDNTWIEATVLEYDTYGQVCATEGLIVNGNVVPTNQYVCDAGSFRMVVMTDLRDNQTYKVTTIGEQTWMAENLCYQALSYNIAGFGKQPYCYYSWNKAMNGDEGCEYSNKICSPARGICPDGWHIPTVLEFKILDSITDNTPTALMASGTDIYGFSAVPAGYIDYNDEPRSTKSIYFRTSSFRNNYKYYWEKGHFVEWSDASGNTADVPIRCLQDSK